MHMSTLLNTVFQNETIKLAKIIVKSLKLVTLIMLLMAI